MHDTVIMIIDCQQTLISQLNQTKWNIKKKWEKEIVLLSNLTACMH